MSIVAVHGPNTFGVAGVGGGGTAGAVTNTGGTVTGVLANGMQFTFAGAGDRAAADYDWSFTGGAGAAAQPNVKNGTVTFTDAGPKVITLTLGSTGGTTPAPGTYTFNVTATTAAPRMARGGEEEENDETIPDATTEEEVYDPADYNVDEVKEYADSLETDEDIRALMDAETEGKNRSTLLAYLESLLPYDPEVHTVDDVVEYATENPDEVDAIIEAERAGKNRVTLLSQLEALQST